MSRQGNHGFCAGHIDCSLQLDPCTGRCSGLPGIPLQWHPRMRANCSPPPTGGVTPNLILPGNFPWAGEKTSVAVSSATPLQLHPRVVSVVQVLSAAHHIYIQGPLSKTWKRRGIAVRPVYSLVWRFHLVSPCNGTPVCLHAWVCSFQTAADVGVPFHLHRGCPSVFISSADCGKLLPTFIFLLDLKPGPQVLQLAAWTDGAIPDFCETRGGVGLAGDASRRRYTSVKIQFSGKLIRKPGLWKKETWQWCFDICILLVHIESN